MDGIQMTLKLIGQEFQSLQDCPNCKATGRVKTQFTYDKRGRFIQGREAPCPRCLGKKQIVMICDPDRKE